MTALAFNYTGVNCSNTFKFKNYNGFVKIYQIHRIICDQISEKMTFLPPDPVFTFSTEPGPVSTLEFCDQTLLLGCFDGHLIFWNLEENKEEISIQIAEESVIAINQPNNKLLITQEKLGAIKLWNKDILKSPVNCINGALTYCKSILHNDYLITNHEDNKSISIIDPLSLQTMKNLQITKDSENFGQITCFKGFESCLWIGFESGQLILYNLQEQKRIASEKFSEFITSIDFDSTNYKGILSNSSNNLELFLWHKGQLIKRADVLTKHNGSNCVRLRNDKKIIASGGWDGRVRLFSWKTLRPLAILTEHNQCISDVKFSNKLISTWNTKNLMAVSSMDGTVSLWNLYN